LESTVSVPAQRDRDTQTGNGGQFVQLPPVVHADRDGLLLTIKTLGNLLDDLERVRIMNGNRIAALEREHGSSLPHLDVIQKQFRQVEHETELELKRAWRRHPLAKWATEYPGIGEKLIARLIAEIGDPGERPNPAKLWAYCGVGDPARKRRVGMTQEEAFKLGNPHAKKLCWLIGESFVKVNQGPGRENYDAARAKYADRVHATACVRCGPAGKPAAPGSPWSLKHQHEAAKRYAVKEFLKALWIVSRQGKDEIQVVVAGGKA
jgi:transposase